MGTVSQLLPGLLVSLKLTLAVLVVGLPCGLLLGVGMYALPGPASFVVWLLTEVGRGLPALVTLYFVYFGLPALSGILTLSPFLSVVVAFGWTTASYTAEIYRSALASVPHDQLEGAQAIGLSGRQTLLFVTIPQALRTAVLPLMGFAILIFQGTSLAYAIGISELMSVAYTTGVVDFQVKKYVYGAAAVYLVVVLAFELLMWLYREGKLSFRKPGPTPGSAIQETGQKVSV